MVKSTGFALLLAVATLNLGSTLAVPIGPSNLNLVSAQRRGIPGDSLTELARRAPTKGSPLKPKGNAAKTQTRSKPRGSGTKTPTGIQKKPSPQAKKMLASKPAAPVDKNSLLKQEFSLEQSRIGLEKQEQAWKPTLLRRDDDFHLERRTRGASGSKSKSSSSSTTKKVPSTTGKGSSQAKKSTPNNKKPLTQGKKTLAAPVDKNSLLKQEFALEQSRIGLEKQEQARKPTLLRRDDDFHLERRVQGASGSMSKSSSSSTTKIVPATTGKGSSQAKKITSNTKKATPSNKETSVQSRKMLAAKTAEPIDKKSLEQSHIGLEKQEQAWKPTLLSRNFEESEFEELVARAPGTGKSSTAQTPKTPSTANTKKSTATTSTTKTKGTVTKKEMPKDWYSKQYSAEEKKVKALSERLTKNTKSHADLVTQYKTEQSNIKAMQEEFKWKPKTWSG
ncbi:hypothetical protein C8J56DRAFT_1022644 [Mycena floridula]|nr:hypothetical protein C8J56DRAFT_1022644 [Mycena floridula]